MIDATIMAAPVQSVTTADLETVTDIFKFRTSRAQLAISAVDSSCFDVLTKNPSHIEQLKKRFADVRWKDPAMYC
jgi:hypothetical protein